MTPPDEIKKPRHGRQIRFLWVQCQECGREGKRGFIETTDRRVICLSSRACDKRRLSAAATSEPER